MSLPSNPTTFAVLVKSLYWYRDRSGLPRGPMTIDIMIIDFGDGDRYRPPAISMDTINYFKNAIQYQPPSSAGRPLSLFLSRCSVSPECRRWPMAGAPALRGPRAVGAAAAGRVRPLEGI